MSHFLNNIMVNFCTSLCNVFNTFGVINNYATFILSHHAFPQGQDRMILETVHTNLVYFSVPQIINTNQEPVFTWIQTTRACARARARGRGSWTGSRAPIQASQAPTVVGTSKGGSQAFKGRR